jgi:UDP:flavonoid glycosyltransferase YjiC (YdhE family)
MSANVLFVSPPEPGHLLPTIPIARQLADKGHRIVYLTTAEYSIFLKRNGFDVELYTVDDSLGGHPSALYSAGITGRELWHRILCGNMRARTPFLQRRLHELVERLQVTTVVVDQLLPFVYGVRFDDIACRTQVAFLWTLLPDWSQVIPDTGIPNVILCPEVFELPRFRRAGDQWQYVEASIDNSRDEVQFDWEWIDERKPLVLCAFGSQARRYSALPYISNCLVEAAQRFPSLQFVIAGRHNNDSKWMIDVASTNIKVSRFIPQLRLLSKTCLLVSHGGLGTIKEAIYMGVPLLIIPFGYDQPRNAQRVRALHLGESVDCAQVTASAITAAITSILSSPVYSEHVGNMMNTFRELERNPRAAECIRSARLIDTLQG